MSFGLKEIAIIAILAILLFGRGRISALMGDLAKGIKSFKKGMASDKVEEDTQKNISENQDSSINQDKENKE
tara:strand:+ start:128 stop:343 length:216 start_codon:yes stop_codon:yes gene_type:complete